MKKLFDITIYETEDFRVMQDWEFPIAGFFIVSGKRKLRSIIDMSDEEAAELMTVVKKVRQAMLDCLHIKDVYFFQNEDSEFEFHLWMFPAHSWMEKFRENKLLPLIPLMRYAKEHHNSEADYAKIREAAERMKRYLEE